MRRFVYSSLKVLHLMGLVLFLGSIFGHIVAGSLGGGPVSGDRLPRSFSRCRVLCWSWPVASACG